MYKNMANKSLKKPIKYFLMMMMIFPLTAADITFFEGELEEGFLMIGQSNEDNTSIYCGNAICDKDETCKICKVDCGSCSFLTGMVIEESPNKQKSNEEINEIQETLQNEVEDNLPQENKNLIVIFFGIVILAIFAIVISKIKKK